jgi:hypothetical protein
MAAITWAIGMACKVEASPGTPETFATGDPLALSDGIVLGDASAGIGESGIDFELARIDKAIAPVTSSFTAQFPSFLRREVAKLSITVQGKGSGTDTGAAVAAADFDWSTLYPGFDALLRASGLTGAAVAATRSYTPASAAPITVKLWVGSGALAVLYVVTNCVAKMTMSMPAGDISLWTFEIQGTVSSHSAAVTTPVFNYGVVATTSAPVVQLTAHSFGISAEARGFTDMSIVIDNAIEDVPDSNQTDGITKRQTDRAVTLSTTLYASATDEDYEDTLLAATSATTDDVIFKVGSVTAINSPAVNWNVVFKNPNLTKSAPVKIGPSVGRAIELQATATSANAEFELNFY